MATIGERRRKEAQQKMEREIELARVSIKKDDVELIVSAGGAEVRRGWLAGTSGEGLGTAEELLVTNCWGTTIRRNIGTT